MGDGITIHISRRAIIIFFALVVALFVFSFVFVLMGSSSGDTGTGPAVQQSK